MQKTESCPVCMAAYFIDQPETTQPQPASAPQEATPPTEPAPIQPPTTQQPDQAAPAMVDTYAAERAAILKKYAYLDRMDPRYKATIHNGRINLRDELVALDTRHAAINVTAEFTATKVLA